MGCFGLKREYEDVIHIDGVLCEQEDIWTSVYKHPAHLCPTYVFSLFPREIRNGTGNNTTPLNDVTFDQCKDVEKKNARR